MVVSIKHTVLLGTHYVGIYRYVPMNFKVLCISLKILIHVSSFSSEVSTDGQWELVITRQRREIYAGYKERFSQTFLLKVYAFIIMTLAKLYYFLFFMHE